MNIVVCVKYVPDAQADRSFEPGDNTTRPRSASTGRAVRARRVRRRGGAAASRGPASGEVTVLTMGPEQAADDDQARRCRWAPTPASTSATTRSHGSDALGTSLVLAKALEKARVRPGRPRADRHGLDRRHDERGAGDARRAARPAAGHLRLRAHASTARRSRIRRDGDAATETIEASLPAVVSVTDQINEPRYPSFKGIMAAKKKPVETWSLADLGVDAGEVGLARPGPRSRTFAARPPRAGRPGRHRRRRRRHEARRVPRASKFI